MDHPSLSRPARFSQEEAEVNERYLFVLRSRKSHATEKKQSLRSSGIGSFELSTWRSRRQLPKDFLSRKTGGALGGELY